MRILEELKQKNEYPMIFIGSGISKRYLENYPSWEELLEKIWYELGEEDYYKEVYNLKKEIEEINEKLSEKEVEFIVNTKMATKIEKKYDEKFRSGEVKIDGLDYKDVVKEKINPFKYYLSSKFKNYKILENNNEELGLLKKVLRKAKFILTTNYDNFIEDICMDDNQTKLNIYVGQRGLFRQETMHSDLYKVHGCSTESNSLIITEEDYKKYDENSVLISAKIISSLLNSPIIFIGYSLTDQNIRKIIKSFVYSLDKNERIDLDKRIILIQREESESNILEEISIEDELGCRLTIIKTDNYKKLYEEIIKIDQGATPSEISKYENLIRELIIDYGKKGEANTVLVSLSQVDNLKLDANKKVAIAIGNSKITPTLKDYLKSYIENLSNFEEKEILKFLSWQNLNANLPVLKIITNTKLKTHLKNEDKMQNKLKKYKQRILDDSSEWKFTSKIKGNSIKDLEKYSPSSEKLYIAIALNFNKIKIEEIKEFLLEEINKMSDDTREINTTLRKILVLYDIKVNNKYKNM